MGVLPMRQTRLAAIRERAEQHGVAERFRRVPHRVAYALDRLPLENAAVLDVGCAYGTALLHFGGGSLGVDNASEAVAFCQEAGLRALRLDVAQDDLAAIPDGGFDYLWISDMLEHTDAPRLILRRLQAKLRRDGRVLLFVSVLPENMLARRLLRNRGIAPFDAEAHFQQYTVSTLRHLVARAGLRVTRVLVPTPGRLNAVGRFLPESCAPRVLVEAVPDERLLAIAETAERRNAAR
jgi:SAM-dependent methyltransferase